MVSRTSSITHSLTYSKSWEKKHQWQKILEADCVFPRSEPALAGRCDMRL